MVGGLWRLWKDGLEHDGSVMRGNLGCRWTGGMIRHDCLHASDGGEARAARWPAGTDGFGFLFAKGKQVSGIAAARARVRCDGGRTAPQRSGVGRHRGEKG